MLKKTHICAMSFASELINWYLKNGRDLPWRHTVDSYTIWLSEIILQQTRVEQGMPYFYRFVEEFPTISAFAEEEEENILRLWQGLGYYSRARNMHKAAKMVMDRFDGIFPTRYEDVIQLTGVGEYTAAAISSFSINEKRAVVDGNVYRVLARYFGMDTAINSTAGKKLFTHLANELISENRAGLYNQAIMDFGAVVCKPKIPNCELCVFNADCVALKDGLIELLPVKTKAKPSRNRYFNYVIIEKEDEILMSKREEGDIWANLYEFPLIETSSDLSMLEMGNNSEFQQYFGDSQIQPIGDVVKHILSHQNIYARFYRLVDEAKVIEKKQSWNYFLSDNLDKLAKHKLIFSFINKYLMH